MTESEIRLIIEYKELDRKVEELRELLFIDSNADERKKITNCELGLMFKQFDAMYAYRRFLDERLQLMAIPYNAYSLSQLENMLPKSVC